MYFKSFSVNTKLCIVFVVFCLSLVSYITVILQRPQLCFPEVNQSSSTGAIPQHLHKYVMFEEGYTVPRAELSERELDALGATIHAANVRRELHNAHVFGPVECNTTVLLVRVHRDVERLQYLLVSLAQLQDIQAALVIFSHGFFDDSINSLIKSITFCRYMQIFYPFSTQLNPNKFPVTEPVENLSLSPRDTSSSRDAELTERKNHWWWQAHFVFSHLEWSPYYEGTVIFLEEDDYVSPDLLYMLSFAKKAQSIILGLNVIAFGVPNTQKYNYDKFYIGVWEPSYKGLAFNKTIWKKISALSSYYCLYDDVSWSQSLYNVLAQLREGSVDMVATRVPRVFTTGARASGKQAVDDICKNIKKASLFPSNVKATMIYMSDGTIRSENEPPPRRHGGSSDRGEHLTTLTCTNMYSLYEPESAKTINNTSSAPADTTDTVRT